MKIVVLDGYGVNPGDLSWEALESLGDVEIYPRTAPEEVIDRCFDAEIVLTNKVVFNKHILCSLPRLKYIGVLATGYNVVDVDAASDLDIFVTNIPAYSTDSVVQMTFAHILAMTNTPSKIVTADGAIIPTSFIGIHHSLNSPARRWVLSDLVTSV